MDERIIQLRVGIVVLCAAIIVAILILLFGEGFSSQYTLFVESATAPGVTPNTPIRKHGVHIGRVAKVESLQDPPRVRLTLRINQDEAIFSNDICEIGSASLLGDAVLDFLPGVNAAGDPIGDGAILTDSGGQVVVATNPIEIIEMSLRLEASIAETLQSIKTAGDRVDAVGQDIQAITQSINTAFAGEDSDARSFFQRFQSLAEKAETAVVNFDTLVANANEIITDEELRKSIRATIDKLPDLLTEAEQTMQQATETIAGFEDVGLKLGANLENLEGFTEALGRDGPKITAQLSDSMGQVDELVQQINLLVGQVGQFVGKVNRSDGTLNKLIEDPELYNNVNDTVKNLNQTVRNVQELTTQLQPLLNDVRYIADGVARSPGSVVRDVFQRKPPYSGFKGSNVGDDRIDYR